MKIFKQTAVALACAFFLPMTHAASQIDYEIQPYADVILGVFHSEKSYANPEDTDPKKTWQEIGAKYGLKGSATLGQNALYASAIGISTGTFGDGDAGNVTNGHERRTNLGEWSLGLKDTPAQEEFAHYDVSVGRQNIIVGDGFMVSGDAVSLGKAVADGELDRGGAYYLATRKAFDFTTALKFRPIENLTAGLFYLKSDNKAQYSTELWVADAMYQEEKFGIGGTFLNVSDVDDVFLETDRKDLKNYALRANYAFNPNLQLKAEAVYQDNARSNENAGYVALNYSIPDSAYHSAVGYRFSHYSEDYDPMFYGNTVAISEWVQGEVAGNYAGPNNRNTNIHQISFSMSPKENLMLGAFAYKFDTIEKAQQNLSAYELDFYSVWSVNKHMNVIPLVGFYKPKKDIQTGGSQFPDDQWNTYAQLLLQYTY